MSKDNDLLKQRKESLLSELESIKYLLGDNDDIPVLDDVIIEESHPFIEEDIGKIIAGTPQKTQDDNASETPDTTLPVGVLPGQQSLFKEPSNSKGQTLNTPTTSLDPPLDPASSTANKPFSLPKTAASTQTSSARSPTSKASLAENPFLPPHVRKRFQENTSFENNDLMVNQSTKASLISSKDQSSMINSSYTERLVDQLIAHHLPKIEAQLRQKLLEVVKTHNEKLKK